MSDLGEVPDAEAASDQASWILIDETLCSDLHSSKVGDDSCAIVSPLEQIDPMKEQNKNRGLSTPLRGRGRKRKRKSAATLKTPTSQLTASPMTKKKKKRVRNRKKSVIVIDSESEGDSSVIEIDGDDTILVISDEEVGVCSGTVSSSADKMPLKAQNLRNVQNSINAPKTSSAAEDQTRVYVPKKRNPPTVTTQAANSELYQPLCDKNAKKTGLRPVVIDGCNVAFGHGRDRFSSLGLKICVDYFKTLGHEVRAFVPQFRKHHSATLDPQILDAMEKDGTVSFTPSRRTDAKMIVSYDDRYIVQYADATGGVIVSRDNYRDLLNENPEWKDTIHKRLLMYTWVGDTIMFPKDPLGRGGPTLQEFLKFD